MTDVRLLPTAGERRLIRELAELRAQIDRVKAGQNAAQLSHSTLYGALPIRDSDDVIRQVIGQQPDGGYGIGHMNGPPPDRPSTAIVTGSMNGLVIEWNGQLVSGRLSDFSHVNVYVSAVGAAFIPGDSNFVGTLSRAGTLPVGPLAPGTTYWVKLRAASTSRDSDGVPILGTESFAATGVPGQVVAAAVIAGIITDLALAAGAVTRAKIAAQAVDGTKIAPDSISSPLIVAQAIQALHVAADAITAGAVAADVITARELAALAVAAEHINANSINAGHLQAGVISADKLAAMLVLATRIIIGNPTGARLELANSGLEQYEDSGARTMRLGDDPASGNYLTIVDPLNPERSLASISDDGTMTARKFTVDDLVMGGYEADELIDVKPRGIVAYAQTNNASTSTTTTIGLMELTFVAKAGRAYRVCNNRIGIVGPGIVIVFWSLTGRATVSSAIFYALQQDPNGEVYQNNTGADQTVRLLLAVRSSTGASVNINGGDGPGGVHMFVEDIGRVRANTGVLSTGGGAGTPPTSRKTVSWNCTWSRCWNPTNLRFSNGEMVQGYYSSSGDNRSAFGFDDANIRAQIAGAVIHDVGLYLYSNHWYYNSGGYARIRSHNSGPTNTYPGVSGTRWAVAMGKPQGLWISLGAGVGNEFRDGTTRGLALDATDVPRNLVDYGRFNGAPGGANAPILAIDFTN